MSADDLEVAKRFRAASRAAVETGDREGFYAFFADDVEYTTLFGTFRGIRELREKLYWASGEPEDLHVELTRASGRISAAVTSSVRAEGLSAGRRRAKSPRSSASTTTSGSATARSRATSGACSRNSPSAAARLALIRRFESLVAGGTTCVGAAAATPGFTRSWSCSELAENDAR